MSTITLPDWFLGWFLVIIGLDVCLRLILIAYRHLLLNGLRERKFSNDDIKRILGFPESNP